MKLSRIVNFLTESSLKFLEKENLLRKNLEYFLENAVNNNSKNNIQGDPYLTDEQLLTLIKFLFDVILVVADPSSIHHLYLIDEIAEIYNLKDEIINELINEGKSHSAFLDFKLIYSNSSEVLWALLPLYFSLSLLDNKDKKYYEKINLKFKIKMLSLLRKDTNANLEEHLHELILSMLRFLPFNSVDDLIEAYSNEYPKRREMLTKCYNEAKQYFYSKAPYIARYSKESHLKDLQNNYGTLNNYDNASKVTFCDLQFGENRQQLAEALCADLANMTSRFDLPPSSTGSRIVAGLLTKISQSTYENQKKDFSTNDFLLLRDQPFGGTTEMGGRYAWASSLAEAVFDCSFGGKPQRIKYLCYDGSLLREGSYPLKYKSKRLNRDIRLSIVRCYGKPYDYSHWHHGLEKLNDTWSDIEDLFEKICNMDLQKPKNKSEHSAYEAKLSEFYSLTAELVWLIGNSQPMLRGSGSFAELILAIVHLHHGLQPPILKLDFPQLDVLDITFPLIPYKFFFPFFFEPNSMPEHLRQHPLISLLSPKNQIIKLYEIFRDEIEAAVMLEFFSRPPDLDTWKISVAKYSTFFLQSSSKPSPSLFTSPMMGSLAHLVQKAIESGYEFSLKKDLAGIFTIKRESSGTEINKTIAAMHRMNELKNEIETIISEEKTGEQLIYDDETCSIKIIPSSENNDSVCKMM